MEEHVNFHNPEVSYLRGYCVDNGYTWFEYDYHDWKKWTTKDEVTTILFTGKIVFGYKNLIHKMDGPAIVHFCGDNEWFHFGNNIADIMNAFCKESDIDPRNATDNELEIIRLKISSLPRGK